MTIHEVKLSRDAYGELIASNRDFDVQPLPVGREYKPGDELHYIEIIPATGWGTTPTGRMIARTITHVIRRGDDVPMRVNEGLRSGFCILGLSR